jgi:cytochrome oxidase assembly protein ShyY1
MMLRPRWVLALVFALAVAAAFALLGQWQLERAIVSGEVVHRDTETVMPLQAVARPGGPVPDAATGQKVSVRGHFVSGQEQLVQGRLNRGTTGYWVVSRFVTAQEPTSIPVARGWAGDKADAETVIKNLATIAGAGDSEVALTGRFLPSEAPVVPPEYSNPHAMTTVSVAALINLWPDFTDQEVYAGYIVDSVPPAGLAAIDSPVPEDDVALNWLNVFYALEWAVFAGFAVFLWYRLVRDAVEREEEEAALQAATSGPGAGTATPPTGT